MTDPVICKRLKELSVDEKTRYRTNEDYVCDISMKKCPFTEGNFMMYMCGKYEPVDG